MCRTKQPAKLWHYVLKELYLPHSSFYSDVNLLKFKMHFNVVCIFFKVTIEYSEAEPEQQKRVTVYMLTVGAVYFSLTLITL